MNMKKFILPIFCLAAGSALANVGYIYKGSGALDDASSWYLITAGSIGNCNYAPPISRRLYRRIYYKGRLRKLQRVYPSNDCSHRI